MSRFNMIQLCLCALNSDLRPFPPCNSRVRLCRHEPHGTKQHCKAEQLLCWVVLTSLNMFESLTKYLNWSRLEFDNHSQKLIYIYKSVQTPWSLQKLAFKGNQHAYERARAQLWDVQLRSTSVKSNRIHSEIKRSLAPKRLIKISNFYGD